MSDVLTKKLLMVKKNSNKQNKDKIYEYNDNKINSKGIQNDQNEIQKIKSQQKIKETPKIQIKEIIQSKEIDKMVQVNNFIEREMVPVKQIINYESIDQIIYLAKQKPNKKKNNLQLKFYLLKRM
jgi:hypothetical protein